MILTLRFGMGAMLSGMGIFLVLDTGMQTLTQTAMILPPGYMVAETNSIMGSMLGTFMFFIGISVMCWAFYGLEKKLLAPSTNDVKDTQALCSAEQGT